MTVQQIYQGWSRFGMVVIPALALALASAIARRGERGAFRLALLAFLCMAGSQALFWGWTYPANRLTENWTRSPERFEAVRAQWEYSHAAAATLTFAALLCLLGCVFLLASARRRGT